MRAKLKQRLWTLAVVTLVTIAVLKGKVFIIEKEARLHTSSAKPHDEIVKKRTTRGILSQVHNETKKGHERDVNIHYWDYTCGYSVESLRSHPLFPYLPFRRGLTSDLQLRRPGLRFGARIFGFLHPTQDGHYVFAVSSDDGSEFWLSESPDPLQVNLVAQVGGIDGKQWTYRNQFDKYASQQSKPVHLQAGKKYYFEILWKQDRGRGHLQAVWKKPGDRHFKRISRDYLSKYYDDSFLDDGLVYDFHLKTDPNIEELPVHVSQLTKDRNKMLRERLTPYQRDSSEFLSLPILDFSQVSQVLPTCDYKPSYIIDPIEAQKLKLYEGVHLPHYFNSSTRVWPHDETWNHTKECYGGPGDHLVELHCTGNYKLPETKAQRIHLAYMRALDKKFRGRYETHTLVNVEESNDDKNGHRYLLEIALRDKKENKIYRLSIYVYLPAKEKRLCYPRNFQWNPNAMVYLTLTIKNQGPWVYQYIMSLARIHRQTNDSRFHLIVVDFDSYDIDLEKILQLSGLPHYSVLKMRGKFHKTIAIQEAADTIKDQNSIILQTDLHLEFPLHFIDDTRKHCVQGKMGYTPLLLRLACGRFPFKVAGFWEFLGYGVFGLYKSDWDVVGGMNVEMFKNKWGGEDWEFGERVLKHGYEIERLKLPYFFHYFHTKKGMWDGSAS